MFVCTLFAELRSQGTTDSFYTPKKSLLKSSYPSQIFVPKKIPESKISNPKKSFDHPRHLISRVPPLGGPLGQFSGPRWQPFLPVPLHGFPYLGWQWETTLGTRLICFLLWGIDKCKLSVCLLSHLTANTFVIINRKTFKSIDIYRCINILNRAITWSHFCKTVVQISKKCLFSGIYIMI